MADVPTYQEVLEMLADKAATGSVLAMIALERALRRDPADDRDPVGETIDRILADRPGAEG
jgi:hypothetical protein